jgi:hypothetical protein
MLKTKLFAVAALLIATPALAELPFNGTWKVDASTVDAAKR